jgi:hypothetical protein
LLIVYELELSLCHLVAVRSQLCLAVAVLVMLGLVSLE